MDFVSLVFFSWLILFVIVFWIPGNRYSSYILVVFGLSFVFFTSPLAGAILLAESLLCYYMYHFSKPLGWLYLAVSVTIVFTAFLSCKFLASKNLFALPLGISYFTFRLIHYNLESYKQRLRNHSIIDFLAYMTFFPTYLVGPINLFPEFLQNLRRRKWNSSQFTYGLERLVYGYAQLVVIGNYLINHILQDWLLLNFTTDQSFSNLLRQSIQLWLDLYIRFSAYSSIAIGISALVGFNVPENFNYPFLATNIREFWQRWHMSLTNWCREYIFVPIAAITRKPFIAIGVTMMTIGIWHELSLRYVLWGFYHALGIIFYERYSKFVKGKIPTNKAFVMVEKILGIVFTLAFVIMSFPITTIVNNFIMSLIK